MNRPRGYSKLDNSNVDVSFILMNFEFIIIAVTDKTLNH